MGFSLPYPPCFAVVGAGAWANLLTGVASPGQRVFGDREAAAQLGLDILQVGVLVFLTGGTSNPFVLLLIAPVTLAAATLPLRHVLALGVTAALLSAAMAFVSLPLPQAPGMAAALPVSFRIGAAIANIAGIALTAGYVRQAAVESARMALALDVTQAVLAREQRLSALGALAAAAAHELGTPLATISIVAKELAREAPTPAVKDDAELLVSQAERCREILRRLTETPAAASDQVHERLSLRQLVQEVIEPHAGVKGVRVEAIVTGAKGMKTPDIRRTPEIAHAFTSFVENAVDFATSEILVSARFDAETISMEVRDDGPGFAPEVLAKLGEPYVTTRPGAEGSRTGHIGMGLGFFIAKTLLERTGALVTFQNGRPHGAVVSARWPRSRIEAGAL
jgi:two-component system sensor histidine kinase RegB